jgi:hypothetical protein
MLGLSTASAFIDPPEAQELRPGDEISEVKLGLTRPTARFVINLTRYAELTVELHENNTASRCAMFISTSDPNPTFKTARWMSIDHRPRKSITILPVDEGYVEGPCYVTVQYTADSGNVFFAIKSEMCENFSAVWYSPLTQSFYQGSWLRKFRHGEGRCVYHCTEDQVEELSAVPYSPVPFPAHDTAIIVDLPLAGCEVYTGEWKMGEKDGNGIYQWADKSYAGSWRAGKRNGRGTLTKVDGSSFTGEWRDDFKHGFGVQIFSNKTRYEGDWIRNKRHGQGSFTYASGLKIQGTWEKDILVSRVQAEYPNGTTYEGGWQEDCRHGDNGVFKDTDGLIYEGGWKEDKKHGSGAWHLPRSVKFCGKWENGVRLEGGEFVFPNTDIYTGAWDETRHVRTGFGVCKFHNGDVYEGEWSNDEMSGKGTIRYADGKTTYEGQWKNSKRHGIGRSVQADGTYDGNYFNNARHGQGKCVYTNGSVYNGEWKDNKRHGAAVFFNSDEKIEYSPITFVADAINGHGEAVYKVLGHHYVGDWKDNKRHGEGTITTSEGNRFTGQWADDERVDGVGTCIYPDGNKYTGQWVSKMRHGEGTCWYKDGSRYEGEWCNDVQHGSGVLYTVDNDQITATWVEGVRQDGKGKCVFANGNTYDGEWENNQPHGIGVLTYPDGTAFEGRFEHGLYRL